MQFISLILDNGIAFAFACKSFLKFKCPNWKFRSFSFFYIPRWKIFLDTSRKIFIFELPCFIFSFSFNWRDCVREKSSYRNIFFSWKKKPNLLLKLFTWSWLNVELGVEEGKWEKWTILFDSKWWSFFVLTRSTSRHNVKWRVTRVHWWSIIAMMGKLRVDDVLSAMIWWTHTQHWSSGNSMEITQN